MKTKIISLLLMIVFCSGCDIETKENKRNNVSERIPGKLASGDGYEYSVIEIKGHQYIIIERDMNAFHFRGLGVVHDPDCPLCNEKEKLKKQLREN